METSAQHRAERRLAAILAADIAGYSRLIGADEEGTLQRLRSIRAEVIDPAIAAHRGRLVKTTGDGLLVEFASVVGALRCAVDIQHQMAGRNAAFPLAQGIEYRVGIHQGDVVVEDGDIFGDGVNVAARLEALADPGGICVSARVQEDAAGRLDLAFEDGGEQQLKNIARPVRVYRVVGLQKGETATHQLGPPLPDKPSIAVLPFQNMSGDREQDYFVDGMVEEIITALSRIPWLFVIARNSTFTYKGQAVEMKRVGRELGIRYVLEGSVRKAGGRVRITTQLIEAETGTHLWADRFDGSLEDVFELQDKIALNVAGIIEPTLQAAETTRAQRRPTADLTAYDLYLRAYPIYFTAHGQIPEALVLLEQAIARDPNYAPALGFAALCCMHLVTDSSIPDPEGNRRKGIDFARRAVPMAGNSPSVLADAAMALACFGEDIDSMIALIDRALVLNPSYARGWHISGFLRLWAGHTDLAIEHAEMALRLSPRAQAGWTSYLIGAALFFSRHFEQAVIRLRLATDEMPAFTTPYRFLAAAYAHMGLLNEARATIARLRAVTPEIMVKYPLPFRDPQHRELYNSGLWMAMGQPEC